MLRNLLQTKSTGTPFHSFIKRGFSKTHSFVDPYKVLGVRREDDFMSIKKTYYKLVGEYHPDKNDSPVSLVESGRKRHVQTDSRILREYKD